MLLIQTRIQPSPLHGLGLFTVEAIPTGQVVWRFVEGFDQRIPVSLARTWPACAQATLSHYASEEDGEFWLDGDDARFINHSGTPNLITEKEVMRASRDIQAGEELSCDYRSFDDVCRLDASQVYEE